MPGIVFIWKNIWSETRFVKKAFVKIAFYLKPIYIIYIIHDLFFLEIVSLETYFSRNTLHLSKNIYFKSIFHELRYIYIKNICPILQFYLLFDL